jgi:hypothetical protein
MRQALRVIPHLDDQNLLPARTFSWGSISEPYFENRYNIEAFDHAVFNGQVFRFYRSPYIPFLPLPLNHTSG